MTRVNPLLGKPNVTPIRKGGATGKVGYFGMTRKKPSGEAKQHNGLDLLSVPGWPVYAAHAGKVTRAGFQNRADPDEGYGKRIYLKDGDTVSVYAHLDMIAVDAGDEVECGELIGHVGRTGNLTHEGRERTPTHLHWGVMQSGAWIDPTIWLLAQ